MEKTTNSPLFSDANEGSHLPINIHPELSKPQRAATSSMRPVSVFPMVELDWSSELRQVNISRQKLLRCSPVPVFLMGEPRLETLEWPDVLTSDCELQQPGPRRSRYDRLLKPRKGLNDSC
ncbi:hypothetical protein TNCV_5121031 [Trichonephila clavipes]|nr:hypothetical protein TNCV_5121031 [Trichonephila clavipes]